MKYILNKPNDLYITIKNNINKHNNFYLNNFILTLSYYDIYVMKYKGIYNKKPMFISRLFTTPANVFKLWLEHKTNTYTVIEINEFVSKACIEHDEKLYKLKYEKYKHR